MRFIPLTRDAHLWAKNGTIYTLSYAGLGNCKNEPRRPPVSAPGACSPRPSPCRLRLIREAIIRKGEMNDTRLDVQDWWPCDCHSHGAWPRAMMPLPGPQVILPTLTANSGDRTTQLYDRRRY